MIRATLESLAYQKPVMLSENDDKDSGMDNKDYAM